MFPPPPPWSQHIVSLGVTGTNGKTTTTTYLAHALETLHTPVLRVTTMGSFLGREKLSVEANYDGFITAMKSALEAGAKYAALECTSEALAAGFAKAWPISMGVFTNLTRDHLDSHGSAEHYLASKAQLFVHLPPAGSAIVNGYDPASALLAEIIPNGVQVVSYGVSSRLSGQPAALPVDISASEIVVSYEGTQANLRAAKWFGEEERRLRLQAVGDMYVENALAALAAAIQMGARFDDALCAIEQTPPVPGRFEVVGTGPRAVIDYGHSPDAIERTLRTARALCRGKLVIVFGAGGGRDKGKRASMGAAARGADEIVLTSDNPRMEDPAAITQAIRQGLGTHRHVSIELDRERAIRTICEKLAADDVVVVAGRGPETHQILADGPRNLVDADVVRQAFGLMSSSGCD